MARGAARGGPVMAVPGCPGKGLGPAPGSLLAFLPPQPSTTFRPLFAQVSWPASWLGASDWLWGGRGTRGLSI